MLKVVVTNTAGPAFAALADRLPGAVQAVINRTAAELLTRIRQNASTGYHAPGEGHIPGTGPGPNVATGDYRRSWAMKSATEGRPEALVFTNSPQGARLEFGFTGADSRGRMFRQPPYPHVRPAMEYVGPRYVAAMRGLMRDLTRGDS